MNGLWHGKDEQAMGERTTLNEKRAGIGVAMDLGGRAAPWVREPILESVVTCA